MLKKGVGRLNSGRSVQAMESTLRKNVGCVREGKRADVTWKKEGEVRTAAV